MIRIIEELKQHRERAKHKFVEMSIIRRYCKEDVCPDTDAYLDEVIELNEAISVLEHHIMPDPSKE